MRIGLVGLGNMGRPMAARIRAAGFELVVFDAREDAARTVAGACGATAADSLATLATHSDVVVTMLPDGAAVGRVVLGPGDRLLDDLPRGAVVVDMGSSSPTGTRDLGAHLAEHGVGMLDAPVSGGVRRATDGTLSIMVGGDPALVARCAPLFRAVGERVFECGGLGSGHAMKALNNLVSAAGLLAAAARVVGGFRVGLDPSRMLDVLNASTGRNYAAEQKLAQFVLSRRFDAGFSLALMVKDLATALDLAHETDTPAPLAAECGALWKRAAAALEPGADHTAIVRWLESLAGVTLEAPHG